jgi:flagellar protein FliS
MSMILSQQNKYLETTIQTASPGQLLIMLIDGAIRFCKLSEEAIKQKNHTEANRNLIKAQKIISEFILTLDRKAPIADKLLPMYEYFNFRLVEANTKKTVEPVEEVIGYLIGLKETWIQAIKITSNQPVVNHG